MEPKILTALRSEINSIKLSYGERMAELQALLNKHSEYVLQLAEYWEGGWGRNDYNHYENFERGRQTIQIDKDYIEKLVLRKFDIDLAKIRKEIFDNLQVYKDFRNKLLTEMSIIRDEDNFTNELTLLSTIEDFDWGFSASMIVKQMTPNNIPIYDYKILSKGIPTPPHVLFNAEWLSLTSEAFSVKEFTDLVLRLIRQIEIKLGKNSQQQTDALTQTVLTNIFENFHSFCRQLRDRYNSRQSIEVEDEYDVQDILHAILKLHFKDVRAEEYTPSYAGSSTRMDFLIKDEELVIEVKKTRKNLDDKEVGNQLILDAAHYANHPNCKKLICFVYDPEGRVRNPRGLEKDISRLSNDNLNVGLYVRP